MAVSLVANVPDDAVVRGVEDVVERDGELGDAKRGAEVASCLRDGVDDVAAELLAELAELREREVLEVDRVVDGVLFFCIGFRREKRNKEEEKKWMRSRKANEKKKR